jgi:hypothetical protein
LTPDFAKLSISPESSDGFASVGTILPKEEAALLPGGLFAFSMVFLLAVVMQVVKMRARRLWVLTENSSVGSWSR